MVCRSWRSVASLLEIKAIINKISTSVFSQKILQIYTLRNCLSRRHKIFTFPDRTAGKSRCKYNYNSIFQPLSKLDPVPEQTMRGNKANSRYFSCYLFKGMMFPGAAVWSLLHLVSYRRIPELPRVDFPLDFPAGRAVLTAVIP